MRIYKLGWEVCESGLLGEITRRAGCANKRRFAKVGVLRNYGARLFIFIKKRAYIFDEFF